MDNFKKTKIVCTIGPNSWDPKTLEKLALAGMDVARLNFSHGSQEEKGEQIKYIRQVSKKLGKPLAVIADFQGPKIRLGEIAKTEIACFALRAERATSASGEARNDDIADPRLELKKGQLLQLSINPTDDELPVQYDLSPFVKQGHRLLLNDGLVETTVQQVNGKSIRVKVQNDGWVSSKKSVNIPDTRIPNAAFTDKDYSDAEFALSQDVDYVAVSFIQSAADLKPIKKLIKKHHSRAKVIVKLEKPQAVEDLENIVKAADVIMVARGDLAVETSAAQVPIIQKRVIRLCRQNFKPVIIATQMLKSMMENPTPTRAEASDVANAVFDQVDAVMTSDETTIGKYPVETVQTMREIIRSVEAQEEYKNSIGIEWGQVDEAELSNRAIAASAAVLHELSDAKLIIAGTTSGKTAQSLSSFRPAPQIIAITHDLITRNQLSLVWGVQPFIVEALEQAEKFWGRALKLVKENRLVGKNDKVIILSDPVPGVGGQTDTIKLETI